MLNGILIVVCDGRFFGRLSFDCARDDKCIWAAQKVALEQTTRAMAGAAVLHNVIIGGGRCSFEMGFWLPPIMQHYVTQLGKF